MTHRPYAPERFVRVSLAFVSDVWLHVHMHSDAACFQLLLRSTSAMCLLLSCEFAAAMYQPFQPFNIIQSCAVDHYYV
jgi:hypothetical protein